MLSRIHQMRVSLQDLSPPPRPPAEPPIVLTRDMVTKMALEGTSIDRASFKLITRGFGPIGAPTMSIDDALSASLLPHLSSSLPPSFHLSAC